MCFPNLSYVPKETAEQGGFSLFSDVLGRSSSCQFNPLCVSLVPLQIFLLTLAVSCLRALLLAQSWGVRAACTFPITLSYLKPQVQEVLSPISAACLGTDKQKIVMLSPKQLSGFKLYSILYSGLCLKLKPHLQPGQTFLTLLALPESKSLELCWASIPPAHAALSQVCGKGTTHGRRR